MNTIVLKETISKALSIVEKAVSVKPQLPILSNILIQARKSELVLSGTDLELGIVHTIGAKVKKEGEAAVPGKLLGEFIAHVRSENIEMTLEKTSLTVIADKTRASLAVVDPTDYPPFPPVPETGIKLPLETLEQAVDHMMIAASADESRPVLTGIRMEFEPGSCVLTATDGYRLSIDRLPLSNSEKAATLILPAKSISNVIRIARSLNADSLLMSVLADKNQVAFHLPQVQIFTRFIDGEYPQVAKIIPASFKTRVVVDREEMLRSVKAASLFARGSSNIVKLSVSGAQMMVSAGSPDIGTTQDSLDVASTGDPVDIAFNSRFLIDILSRISSEQVVMELSGPLSPGCFRPEQEKSPFFHIIMPIRVQS